MITIFLDFDGVLFDTLREAFILCRYAYSNTDIFEPIDEDIYKLFYRYKFLVYNSWQYYYMMKILEEKEFTNDEEFIKIYNNLLLKRDISKEKYFDEKYLQKRIELMDKHIEYWNSLEKPFPFFEKIKKLFIEGKINPIIVSKKNKFAIQYRINQYGLELSDDKIFAKEELLPYQSKAEFMNKYMIKNKINKAVFVDDNSNNIRPCSDYPNIIPLLAGWGNIAINEIGMKCEEIGNIIHSFMIK